MTNVIIVDIDTLRADRLGVYGNPRATSPSLDRFADDALRFEYAFSQAPNTPPSQASILTALYPTSHGYIKDGDRLSQDALTLAEILEGAGFLTAAFVDGGYMSEDFGMDQGFQEFFNGRGTGLGRSAPLIEEWLSRRAEEPGRPFFLLVHTYDVHTPYAPPEPYRSMFLKDAPEPTPGFEPTTEAMNEIRLSVYTDEPKQLAPNDLEYSLALYDSGIRFVDDWFGRFVRQLDRTGLAENTAVVFLSDHGEEFQEHGSVLHEKLYATVTRVPLLLRYPGGPRGAVRHDPVEALDVMPTLLALLGLPAPKGIHGASLLSEGDDRGRRSLAFGESPYFGVQRSLVRGRFHLIHTEHPDRVELFDFGSDPLESTNLAAEHPEVVEQLRGLVENWRTFVESSKLETSAAPEVRSETHEQLRALGYVD